MNINKLKEGQIKEFKNYKVACEFLEEEIKSGKSKKIQLEDWERYFAFHKEAQKIIIDCIYDKVIPKTDKRLEGNNSKYKDNISILLLDLLAQSESGELFLSAGTLLKKLDMVNNNYTSGRRHIAKLSEITNVPEQHIYDFYNYTQSKLKSNLESALNNLRSKSVIIWSSVLTVCYRNIDIELNNLQEIKIKNICKDRVYFDTNLIHRESTSEERQLILKCEKEVIKELGLDNQQQVFLSGLWNTFRNKVNEKLKNQGNIEYYYNSYKITYDFDNVLDELDEVSKFKVASKLNQDIMISLADSSSKRHAKALDKIKEYEQVWGKSKEEIKAITILHSDEKYLDYNEELICKTIYMLSEDLNKELKLPVDKKKNPIVDKSENDDIPF